MKIQLKIKLQLNAFLKSIQFRDKNSVNIKIFRSIVLFEPILAFACR
jgi:hypothetical protein